MGLNHFRNEAGKFIADIGKTDEPMSVKLRLLEEEFELLRASVDDPEKLRHQIYDMLFILFTLAAQQDHDLDLEWEKGRLNKSKKYGTSG